MKEADINPIDDEVLINGKGTKLFVHIKGNNNQSPLLIYLHGGPGSPLGIPIFKAYAGCKLEQEFIVVYLHQRGIMKSDRIKIEEHTISNYVEDVNCAINYLKDRFAKREIFLVGHSWGGLLAYMYLLNYPDEIDKLVTVCTPINIKTIISERIEIMLQWASENNHQDAVTELMLLKNKSLTDLKSESEVIKKWMTKAYGGWHRNLDIKKVNEVIEYENMIPEWMKEQKLIEDVLIDDILAIDLCDSLEKLSTPLLCIVGKQDTNSPWYAIKRDIQNYGGKTTFKLFENSHHMVFIDEEELFLESVINFCQSN